MACHFCAGSLNSLKQEGGLYRDTQRDAAIAWYWGCWERSVGAHRKLGPRHLWPGPVSNLFQGGEAHHTHRGAPSEERLSPGPSECRGEGLGPELQAQRCHHASLVSLSHLRGPRGIWGEAPFPPKGPRRKQKGGYRVWPAKSGSTNPLLSVDCLELNGDFSHPSQGVLCSDGVWRVKSIPSGKGETCPGSAGRGWADQGPRERHVSSAFHQVPLHSPLLHLQSHGSPPREASKSGQTSSESISILGASV